MKKFIIEKCLMPMVGIGAILILWTVLSRTIATELPSPAATWENMEGKDSNHYITQPFADRGGPDKGLVLLTLYSLGTVMKGYLLAIAVGAPLGFLLGGSKRFALMFDPLFQILRPVSPLAWYPLGAVLFAGAGKNVNELGAMFTIAVCAMWPTVLNTATGVRAIPQDYHNVAKVLKLSKLSTLFKILIPAALPQMFTGFRLSLGIAWLVIVAVEMLTGRIGIGAFLWHQGYNSTVYAPIILSIIMIGLVGFMLDRLMSVVEANVMRIAGLPGTIKRLIGRLFVKSEPVEVAHVTA